MHSAKQLHNYIISKIEPIYGKQEANGITFLLMERFNLSKLDYVLDNTIDVDEGEIDNYVSRLLKQEPIQYILEEATFYDRVFKVNKDVLIPRIETEELCSLIISKHGDKPNLTILDIGTGSGCIPITLDLELPLSKVTSLDISKVALEVASENAQNLKAKIKFINLDILEENIDLSSFDVVVSNPPYVLNSEKKMMSANVLENEPHSALFVEDQDPLIFYEKIANLCVLYKTKDLYFEINEKYGSEIKEIMVTYGFTNVSIIQDYLGKDRIVHGCNIL